MNFNYKTYDSSGGFGNKEQWEKIFNEIFGHIDFEKIFEQSQSEFKNERKKVFTKTKKSNQSNYFNDCQSETEIKTKFRKLMTEHHPDRGGDVEICKKIIAEYNNLI